MVVVGDSFNIASIAQELETADPNYTVAGYIDTKELDAPNVTRAIPKIKVEALKDYIKERKETNTNEATTTTIDSTVVEE